MDADNRDDRLDDSDVGDIEKKVETTAIGNNNDDNRITRSQSSSDVFFYPLYMPEFCRSADFLDDDDDQSVGMKGTLPRPPSRPNSGAAADSEIIRVPSKMFIDMNRIAMFGPNRYATLSSRCSTQSSSTTASSSGSGGHHRGRTLWTPPEGRQMVSSAAIANQSFSSSPPPPLLPPFSSSSLSRSLSVCSSVGTATANDRRPGKHSSGSMIEAAQKFLDFIQCYELSLIECLSNIRSDLAQVDTAAGSSSSTWTICANETDDGNDGGYCHCNCNATGRPTNKQPRMIMVDRNVPMINENERNDYGPATDNDGVDGSGGYGHYGSPAVKVCGRCRRRPHEEKVTATSTEGAATVTVKEKQVLGQQKQKQIAIGSPDHNDHGDGGAELGVHGKLVAAAETTTTTATTECCWTLPDKEKSGGTDTAAIKVLRSHLEKVRALRQEYDRCFRYQEAIERLQRLTINRRSDINREWATSKRMLASVEQQLEKLIGSFVIRVEQIEGWARICPRDVYEIEFLHAKRRQMLRVRIRKSSERKWHDNRQEVSFEGFLDPVIVCRVRELKQGWRNFWPPKRHVDVGVATISVFELLESATKCCPILLDANPSGTIKLRIVCHWRPYGGIQFGHGGNRLPLAAAVAVSECCTETATTPTGREEPVATAPKTKARLDKPSHKTKDRNDDDGGSSSQRMMKGMQPTAVPKSKMTPMPANKFPVSQHLARSLLTLPTYHLSDNVDDANASFATGGGKATTLPGKNTAANAGMLPAVPDSSMSMGNVSGCCHDDDIGGLGYSSDSSSSSSVTGNNDYDDDDQDRPGDGGSGSGSSPNSVGRMLAKLLRSLGDYGGQAIEITRLWQSVDRLTQLYHSINHHLPSSPSPVKTDTEETTSQDLEDSSLLINDAFRFLDDPEGDDQEEKELEFDPSQDWTDWHPVIVHHLSSALKHLNHTGAWILKSRERWALAKLQADTFALDKIHGIVSAMITKQPLGEDALGNDSRVLELWSFMKHRFPRHKLTRMMYTRHQFCAVVASLIVEYDLIPPNCGGSAKEMDEIIQYASQWLVAAIAEADHLVDGHGQDGGSLTIFTVRAFFELSLYRRHQNPPEPSSKRQRKKQDPPCLRDFLQIAIDLSRLVRIRTDGLRTSSVFKAEQVLFRSFHVGCHWIPADLTMAMVAILYEYRCRTHESQSPSLSTAGQPPSVERLRELAKKLKNWLSWLLEGSRFEIRAHILAGLESPSALVRRVSCYGVLCLTRLLKRIQEKKGHQHRQQLPPPPSSKIETDCLLYMSLEDPDERVREEARRSLKYLGNAGQQQRLKHLERTRLGFCATNTVVSETSSPVGGSATTGIQYQRPQTAAMDQTPTSIATGTSMPNLSTFQWSAYETNQSSS